MIYGTGYIQSPHDDRDQRYEASTNLPKGYKLKSLYVADQGATSKCAAYTAATMLDWWNTVMATNTKTDIDAIYDRRANAPQEGMVPRDVFAILKHNFIKQTNGSMLRPITAYKRCYTIDEVKSAILANGPVFIGMLVKNIDNEHFWLGSENQGGHAVSLVGWDDRSFILKNSWGTNWGYMGYTDLPFEDFDNVLEAWTILR